MSWKNLAEEFEAITSDGDANVEWIFDAGAGIRRQWLISHDQACIPHRELWELFARAGRSLPTEGAPRSIFPTKLLAEPSPDWRWLSALRHVKIHVVHQESPRLRSDSGMIYAVAKASAELCRRLSASERFPRVGPHQPMRLDDFDEGPHSEGDRTTI